MTAAQIIRLAGYDVDFSRLLWQRQHPACAILPRPRLALGYALLQTLAAIWPSKRPTIDTLHEGLGREHIGRHPDQRTGRFSWAGGRTLYLVPGCWAPEPDSRSRIWMLRGAGFRWAWRTGRELWRQWRQHHPPLVAELVYRAIPYGTLYAWLRSFSYVTTSAGLFPESPAIPMANAMGVKTILWMYGNQHVLPASVRPLRWDIPAAARQSVSEVHLWNERARGLWRANQIGADGPTLIVDGPRMLGRQPSALPPSRCIGVADTPAKRLPRGVFTPDWVDAFYGDLMLVAQAVPRQFIVKPKYDNATVQTSALLARFSQLPNVERLDADSNPWTLIERCGLLICLPFSAMGAAALAMNRDVLFYDPTGAVRAHPYPEWQDYLVVGCEALKARVWMWVQGVPEAWRQVGDCNF